ncbi:hypothetical protein C1645_831641 [Glomus cerebriforme]|uniref:Uncharacterized protein n=1 Tax=Glomus cerebriforme TaxID=658196 RepID=A0A397SPV8_9GLOM|nr:hypothetical protein C1645_831641 [Glomus cerebriforme]
MSSAQSFEKIKNMAKEMLGERFITEEVMQGLIARGAIISRYFVQRLVMQFGVQHPESKIVSWAADLPLTAFTRLITEAVHQLNGDFGIRGNDIELFQHLTTCTFSISTTQFSS